MASQNENIVTLLRSIAETVNPTGRFIYGRELHSSFDFPNNALPNAVAPKALISLFPFTVTNSNLPDANFDSTEISLLFSRSADVTDNAAREEEIINEMSELAELFEAALIGSAIPKTYVIRNIRKQAEYLFFMGTNSGVAMTFTLNILKTCS